MFEITEIKLPGAQKRVKEPDVDAIPVPVPRPYAHHAFRLILVGPSGSGKSLIFVNLLIKAYSGIFNNVYIFCPTFHEDTTLKALINKNKDGESCVREEDVYTESDPKELEIIIEDLIEKIDRKIKSAVKKHPDEAPPKTLMVFDDLTNELKNSRVMKNIFTKGRKHEISVIVMTNKYRVYDPQIRANATHYIFFKPSTEQEETDVVEDIRGMVDPKRMKMVLSEVYKKPDHPFLYVDKTNEKRFWFKFRREIPLS